MNAEGGTEQASPRSLGSSCRSALAVPHFLFLALLLFGFVGHLRYLTHDCPIDLSGDEAQYWDWSRQLDWSYYSKGPLVAWVIRASCAAFGRDTMLAVRFPALLFAAGASTLTYLLTRKLFGSDRIALGAVLLNHIVPMFVAGSVLMTIDPPFFFFWALATYLAATAIFDGRPWAWPAAGAAAGVGFLAKYTMLLWFVPVLLFLATDPNSRKRLRTPGPWAALGVALLCTMPVLIWNARHGWVSARHVVTQTGADGSGKFSPLSPLEFLGGQAGIVGPGLVVMMTAAVLYAFRPQIPVEVNDASHFCRSSFDPELVGGRRRKQLTPNRRTLFPRPPSNASGNAPEPHVRQMRFLACVGLSLLGLTLLASLRTKVQLNWPAPAYFTLMILTAYFLATRLRDRRLWRGWRWWFYPSVAFGLIVLPVAHNPQLLYPAARWLNARTEAARASRLDPRLPRASWPDGWLSRLLPARGLDGRQVDFAAKLKGWQQLGAAVSDERDRLGPGAFVLCSDYQETAEMAFYARGQPKTYYLGSYFRRNPKRLTQYDFWPDRSLEPDAGPAGHNPLLGRNAIFVGQFDKAPPELIEAFENVFDPADDGNRVPFASKRAMQVNVWRDGLQVQSFRLIRCYGFRGLKRPKDEPAF